MAARQQSDRQRLYGLLAIAKRDLGWDEDRYRAHLAHHGAQVHRGRPSAVTMSYAQIEAALAAMQAHGWRPTAPLNGSILSRCHHKRRDQWRKVIRLWCLLADAGEVRDRSEAAMLEWARRHIDEEILEWAGAKSLSSCIEALKDWAARNEVELD